MQVSGPLLLMLRACIIRPCAGFKVWVTVSQAEVRLLRSGVRP